MSQVESTKFSQNQKPHKRDTPPQKVMLGSSAHFVTSKTPSRSEMEMRAAVTDLLSELNKATSVRSIYEGSIELPLEDLFFVGGQLQRLIRHSEEALASFTLNFPGNIRPTIHSRLDEVRAFRNYIVKRIKQGA